MKPKMILPSVSKVCLFGCLALGISVAQAVWADPWTDGGSNVYVTDTSDVAGIGTSSPVTKLHVNYDGNAVFGLRLNNTYSGGRSWTIGDGVSAHGGFSIYDTTGSADRFFISSAGNVGIGTTSPATKMQVSYDANSVFGLRLTNTYSGGHSWTIGDGKTAHGGFSIYDETASADRFLITSGGLVGIGGITPVIDFAIGDTDTGLEQVSDGELALYTNNNSRIRIDSSGKVGIGTTSPSMKLDVDGNANITGDVTISETLYGPSGTGLTLQSQSGRAMFFNTDGTSERMRIASDGDVIVQGQVGVATATPGIDFAIGDNDTGLEQVGNGILTMVTDGVEVFRVTTSQNIRVGNSTGGTGKLYVEKNDSFPIYAVNTGGDNTYGSIYGEASNAGNYNTTGVYGVTQGHGNSPGQPIGVRGDARYTGSPQDGQFGVLGYNYSQGDGADEDSAGVWGGSVGTPGDEGDFDTYGNGVQGETYSTNNYSGGGIFFSLSDTGDADGLVGKTDSNSANSYGVYSSGTLGASGSKPAIVYTESQGPSQLYAEEATEIYFADYGMGQLKDGYAKIELDPLFLETVTISEDNPMHVFIQSYGDAVMYVDKNNTSFEVQKMYGSDNHAEFSYRILAKRKYYDDQRMVPTKVTIDKHMRPDLDESALISLNERWGLEYFTDEELLPNLLPEPEKLLPVED